MIVKNEAPVIRRCLASVRPLVDAWVVSDTGSTDGTQDLVLQAMEGVPGTLIERPWVDFAHNRNEALALARQRADYILVIDADERMEADPGFRFPADGADSYDVEVRYAGTIYHRKQVVRAGLPWAYVGVLHEVLSCPEAVTEGRLPGLRTIVAHEGARSRDPNTYKRDALVLERALLDAPDDPRNTFYLAQSYRDAGDFELALRWYRRRAALAGWRDEQWHALYQIGRVQERMGAPWAEAAQSYLAAFDHSPERAEPLYWLGLHYQHARNFPLAHLFLGRAMAVARPGPERLFVEAGLYDVHIPLEYAVSCYWTGRHAEAIAVNDRLLAGARLAPALREQVTKNRQFSADALAR